MAWTSSNRRAELPPNWPAIVAHTRDRAGGQCQWVEQGQRCPLPGTDCDHAGDRNDHSNTQWLCEDHHKRKTQQEAQEARAAQRAKLQHPSARAQHPGLL